MIMYISGGGQFGSLYEKQDQGGIVTFITPSSYLLLAQDLLVCENICAERFDEFWVIDLEGG